MHEQPPEVKVVFDAALEFELAAERKAYLDRIGGRFPEVRARVDALLAAYAAADSFLLTATRDDLPRERPGSLVGPYKLMEQIGAGGFGLVFVAEQQHPVRRKVALKIIKPGMDTRDVVARFEAERQALALMDHPNIARVFDAGTTDSGLPYFVMELVKGVSIVEYCDRQRFTARERLDLFLHVCQAVQHAHGKGIIHRDLKPSNILVASHDGVPVVKVIDFGVAKAVGQRLTDKTVYTRFTQMIGTPLYMSPEQAEFSALDVDTRSDVYSLGVLLYELLTGTTPFDRQRFAKAAYDEIRRIIKEEEPPRPSTRLSTMGESLSKVSSQRKIEPAKLSALVRGELDWIIMRCLEKDRNRRYETANSLAKDVERYLNDEPVEACPPTFAYRLQTFYRKNRVPVRMAAAILAAALAAAFVCGILAFRAIHAERIVAVERDEAAAQRDLATAAQQLALSEKAAALAAREELRRLNYVADMNLARHAWEENNILYYKELVERHRPRPGETDLRGFEWYYLDNLPSRDCSTLRAHGAMITNVVWTPDDKQLVSFGGKEEATKRWQWWDAPREIKVWDVATKRAIERTFEGDAENVMCGALSPDGRLLAAGCRDGKIRVWNFETGRLVAILEDHKQPCVDCVVFSPDGKLLASTGNPIPDQLALFKKSSEICIWDSHSDFEMRKPIARIDGLHYLFERPSFSPDGGWIAAGSTGNILRVWEARSGAVVYSKDMEARVHTTAFSPDGKELAVSTLGTDLRILDAKSGTLLKKIPANTSPRWTLAYSRDGKHLIAAGLESAVQVWNVETGKPTHTFRGHLESVRDIACSHDGSRMATAGTDGLVKIWTLSQRRDLVEIPAVDITYTWIKLSPSGRIALTGYFEKTCQLWNAATARPIGSPLSLGARLVNRAFSADETRLFLFDANDNVVVVDAVAGREAFRFKLVGSNTANTAVSPDGKWLVCSIPDGGLKLWDVERRVPVQTFPAPADFPALQFSTDGARLAVGGQDGAVKIWDVASGKLFHTFDSHAERAVAVLYSPDGKWLAVFGGANLTISEVRILDAETGEELQRPLKITNPSAFTFSPDSRRLVIGNPDGTVKLCDPTTGQETLTLNGHTGRVTSLAFSPDGRRLISAGADFTIRTWDATWRAE